MGWENRPNGQYYYRKRRVGNRVVSEYAGFGAVGVLAANEDALEREHRKRDRITADRIRQTCEDEDSITQSVEKSIVTLTKAFLIAYGYHTSKGTWKRKRY